MPKQEVAYPLVGQSSLQEECGQVTVQVWLILQNLYQLQEVLEEFVITVDEDKDVKFTCRLLALSTHWCNAYVKSPDAGVFLFSA